MSETAGSAVAADAPRATVAEAIAAWEAKGPTSLTVALMADALYGVHDAFSDFAGKHGAALSTIARDPRDPDFAEDWCALAAKATTVQARALPPGAGAAPCEVHVPGRDQPSPWCAACRMSGASVIPTAVHPADRICAECEHSVGAHRDTGCAECGCGFTAAFLNAATRYLPAGGSDS